LGRVLLGVAHLVFVAMATVDDLPRPDTYSQIDARAYLGGGAPPPIDIESGAPTSMRAFCVSKDPKMTVVPHFFSDEECDHLLGLVDGYWMPSMVGQGSQKEYEKNNLNNALSLTRTSWSCMTRPAQTAIIERLEARIASIAGMPLDHLERLNLVRYAPGEEFGEHHDGKFRPWTVFVYLNDLPANDEGGDTFFPVLGLSFKAQKGSLVMWPNCHADGKEDSRMIHCGTAPLIGIKYGVNCFFNEGAMKRMWSPSPDFPLEDSATFRISDLSGDGAASGSGGSLTAYALQKEPLILAVPGFLTNAEAEQLLGRATSSAAAAGAAVGPFAQGTQTLRGLQFAEDATVQAVEERLCSIAGKPFAHLGRLRLVRAGFEAGLCNRGCGSDSAYVCLSDHDEVFFNKLGLRLVLRRGEAIVWPNVIWENINGVNRQVEEVRTLRVHLTQSGIGIDAFWHDNPIRDQQAMREFVPDSGPPHFLPPGCKSFCDDTGKLHVTESYRLVED